MHTLIFEPNIQGHRLEYLHHLYSMAGQMPEHKITVIVPKGFSMVKKMFEWPEYANVSIFFIEDKVMPKLKPSSSFINQLYNSYQLSKSLIYYIDQFHPDRVFLISLMNYLPFVCSLWNKNIHIAGIIYNIYLYENRNSFSKIVDKIKYLLLSKTRSFHSIYILNDKESVNILNRIYTSNKFKYLPDPYSPADSSQTFDFRKKYAISSSQIVFSHFGGLQQRKGTLDILESISKIERSKFDKYVFVFAGKVYDDFKEVFYKKIAELKNSCRIIVEDSFCDYSFLASLCIASNAIVIPYHRTSQSSGLIGYAAQFQVPVIAPNYGLIQKLVNSYKLGILIEKPYSSTLMSAYSCIEKKDFVYSSNHYCQDNNIDAFQKSISIFFC